MRHFAKTGRALGFGLALVVAGAAPSLAFSHGGAGMARRGVNVGRPPVAGAPPVVARPNGGFAVAHPQAFYAGRPAGAGGPVFIRPHVGYGAPGQAYYRGRYGERYGGYWGQGAFAAGGGFFAGPVAPYYGGAPYYPDATEFPTPAGPPSDTPTGYGVTYNIPYAGCPWVPPAPRNYVKIITLHPHEHGRLTQSITVIRPYSVRAY